MDVVAGGRRTPGGGPFNTARALARLGVPVAFLGRLSRDPAGRELAAVLAADGVDLSLASVGPERTTEAVAHVDDAGRASYRFAVDGTSAPQLTRDMLPVKLDPSIRAVHVGSLGLTLEPIASTLLGLIEREARDRVVMLDPNVRPGLVDDRLYRERLLRVIERSAIVKASADDLAWLYPALDHRAAARRILASGARLAIVTLGSSGAFSAHRDLQVSVPAVPVEVVDTIGAGDAFGAAVLAWLHDRNALRLELDLDEAAVREMLAFACLTAALTCTRSGAEPPWRRDVLAAGRG